jgi:hypothetical protein
MERRITNSLQDYLASTGLDETQAMNEIQEHGIISDNCVTAAEVGDSGKAVAWLANHHNLLPTGAKSARRSS